MVVSEYQRCAALGPHQLLERAELLAYLMERLGALPPRTRLVLELRFGLSAEGEKTNRSIAQVLGVTHQAVEQRLARGLRRLRTGWRLQGWTQESRRTRAMRKLESRPRPAKIYVPVSRETEQFLERWAGQFARSKLGQCALVLDAFRVVAETLGPEHEEELDALVRAPAKLAQWLAHKEPGRCLAASGDEAHAAHGPRCDSKA